MKTGPDLQLVKVIVAPLWSIVNVFILDEDQTSVYLIYKRMIGHMQGCRENCLCKISV